MGLFPDESTISGVKQNQDSNFFHKGLFYHWWFTFFHYIFTAPLTKSFVTDAQTFCNINLLLFIFIYLFLHITSMHLCITKFVKKAMNVIQSACASVIILCLLVPRKASQILYLHVVGKVCLLDTASFSMWLQWLIQSVERYCILGHCHHVPYQGG